MHDVVLIAQIFVSVLLTGAILLQSQGQGLGAAWGGGGESYHTKRGVERALFTFTIIGIILFVFLILASFVVV